MPQPHTWAMLPCRHFPFARPLRSYFESDILCITIIWQIKATFSVAEGFRFKLKTQMLQTSLGELPHHLQCLPLGLSPPQRAHHNWHIRLCGLPLPFQHAAGLITLPGFTWDLVSRFKIQHIQDEVMQISATGYINPLQAVFNFLNECVGLASTAWSSSSSVTFQEKFFFFINPSCSRFLYTLFFFWHFRWKALSWPCSNF